MSELPPPEPLSAEAFAAYGTVLRRDPIGEPFQEVHTDTASRGWRVALLEVSAGPLRRVHRHPDSEECFAPLHGSPCIAVAEPDTPTAIRVFRLDEPVCVRRNVWHEVVAAGAAGVFIAENAVVTGEPIHLDAPLTWAAPRQADVEWTVTVTEPLPDCPSVAAGWRRIATQTTWGEWRSASSMRGKDVTTSLVPPATEPLQAGDEYVVKVGRALRIRCRVLESSGRATGEDVEMVFDATGVALGGVVRARFRFTVFRGGDGTVMARAQERITTLPFLAPPKETLEREHRHTFRDLNASFRA